MQKNKSMKDDMDVDLGQITMARVLYKGDDVKVLRKRAMLSGVYCLVIPPACCRVENLNRHRPMNFCALETRMLR